MTWKDETSYNRDDKRREPKVLSLGLINGFKLIVHRLIGCPDLWFMSIRWHTTSLVVDKDLTSKNLEQAKEEAVRDGSGMLKLWARAMGQAAEKLEQVARAGKQGQKNDQGIS